ncbi:hypothetical protein AB0M92_36495 [Streptomyces sp. NPDC051582]|uniref:hypothetical protein n=1 Tax=Streptomyces sp. NPDC051582 TaxID=3155167 RepID=UPI00341C7944
MGGARREGRPWSGAKGPVPEINAVAELLHQYMDDAGLSVKDVHDKLGPENFPKGVDVPTQRQFYDLLDGKKLTLDVAHAIIDVCSGPDGDARVDAQRREEIGDLFRRASQEPRLSFRELVTTGEKMIALRTSLESLQTAYKESSAARETAEVVAVSMLGLLLQMQNAVSSLTRQRDQLRSQAERQPAWEAEVRSLQTQLDRALERERGTRALLDTAMEDKESADRTANAASLMIVEKEAEIERLRAAAEAAEEARPAEGDTTPALSDPVAFSVALNVNLTPDEASMAQADAAVLKAQVLLEQGRDAVAASQERIAEAGAAGTLVADPPVTEPSPPPFSGTTPPNALSWDDAALQAGSAGGGQTEGHEDGGRHRRGTGGGTGRGPGRGSGQDSGDLAGGSSGAGDAVQGSPRLSRVDERALQRVKAADGIVLAVLILTLCTYTSVTVVLALPAVRHDLLSRLGATAPMITCNLLAAAVTGWWGHSAALRYGPRRVLLPGLLFLSAGSLIASWTPAYENSLDWTPQSVIDWPVVQLLTGCVLQGLGEGLCVAAAGYVLSGSRGFAWPESRCMWAVAAGSAIAVAASGFVLSTWIWRIAFQVPGAAALLLLLTLPLVSGRGTSRAPRPDTWLMVLTATANAALVWIIETAAGASWPSALLVLAVGVLALCGCARRLKNRESVEGRDSALWVPAIWAWVGGAVQCTAWLYSALALQQVFRHGPWTAAALLLLAVPPVALVVFPRALPTRLRAPSRIIGLLATAGGLLWLANGLSDPAAFPIPALMGALALVGAGTAVLRCPPTGLSPGRQRTFDAHTKYSGALTTVLSTTLITHAYAVGSRTGGTEAHQADAYATVLTAGAAAALAAAIAGALPLVRRHLTTTAGASSAPGERTRPTTAADASAVTAYVLLFCLAPALTVAAALIAGAGNRVALFSQPGASTLALILYCLIGLCVLAAIAGAAIAVTIWPVKMLGGPNAPTYMSATTLIAIPVALTAGNFITYQPLVTAGTWIAGAAGLL